MHQDTPSLRDEAVRAHDDLKRLSGLVIPAWYYPGDGDGNIGCVAAALASSSSSLEV